MYFLIKNKSEIRLKKQSSESRSTVKVDDLNTLYYIKLLVLRGWSMLTSSQTTSKMYDPLPVLGAMRNLLPWLETMSGWFAIGQSKSVRVHVL